MKIVQIEDFFHPDAGYQINILSKYMAKNGHQVTIITASLDKLDGGVVKFFGKNNIQERDRAYSKRYNVKIVRIPVKRIISGRAVFGRQLISAIKKEMPDIVYAHGNDTLSGMQYLCKYNRLGYPLIMDSHMLEMASVNRFNRLYRKLYKKIFTPIIIKNKIQVIRTQNDPYVEKCLGIPLSQAPWISVGSDTMLFHPDNNARKEFRKKHAITENDFVVLYAGKLDESKGGMLLAEAIKEKLDCTKNVTICIVGKTLDEYGEKVEETFRISENRILRFPTQKYEDLAIFYQAADLAVFPRQCSLSFYDVQACGLPVLFEENSVNIGRAQRGNALTFKVDDVKGFREGLIKMIDMNADEFKAMGESATRYVEENFDYKDIATAYLDLINCEMIRQKRSK